MVTSHALRGSASHVHGAHLWFARAHGTHDGWAVQAEAIGIEQQGRGLGAQCVERAFGVAGGRNLAAELREPGLVGLGPEVVVRGEHNVSRLSSVASGRIPVPFNQFTRPRKPAAKRVSGC